VIGRERWREEEKHHYFGLVFLRVIFDCGVVSFVRGMIRYYHSLMIVSRMRVGFIEGVRVRR